MKILKVYRRWHIESNERGYVITHAVFSKRADAVKIAGVLSESLAVRVIDKLHGTVVWGN